MPWIIAGLIALVGCMFSLLVLPLEWSTWLIRGTVGAMLIGSVISLFALPFKQAIKALGMGLLGTALITLSLLVLWRLFSFELAMDAFMVVVSALLVWQLAKNYLDETKKPSP